MAHLETLDLEVTSACNLRCSWCFVEALGRARHLAWKEAVGAVEQARALGARTLHVTGGEPLVWPHLESLLQTASDLGYAHVLLNTNAHLLDDHWCQLLAALPARVELTISVDGPEELHEANRGPGSYRRTLEGLSRALEAGLAVRVFTIATQRLVPRAAAFALGLFQAFPDLAGLSFIPVGDVGRPDTSALTAAQLVDLTAASAAFLLTGRSVRILDFPVANLVYRALRLPIGLVGSHCTACRSRIAVQSDGTITPCHPVWAPLGSIAHVGLAEAVESEACSLVRERQFDACAECPDRDICGHCRAVVLAQGLPLHGFDGFCRKVRRELEARPDLAAEVAALAEHVEQVLGPISGNPVQAETRTERRDHVAL